MLTFKTAAVKRKLNFLIFFLVLAISLFGQKTKEELVRKTFDSYKSAILNDRGDDAVKFIDSRTIKYYNDVLDWVKNADSAKVETLSILDKLIVFSIRHQASKEDIQSFDGKSLLIYAIKSGMVGKNSVANLSIGDITVDENFAKGQVVSNGVKAPLFMHFYKEEAQWKIDLTSLFAVSTSAFNKIAEDSGKGENEFLFDLLEMITGKKPGKEIWTPVN